MKESERLLKNHEILTDKARAIMSKKNHDYTGGSGDPYANFRMSEAMGVHPALGLLIRVGDKMQRVRTFAERGELQVDGEGLEDAVIDVINYMVLVYSLLTEDEKVFEVTDDVYFNLEKFFDDKAEAIREWYNNAESGDVLYLGEAPAGRMYLGEKDPNPADPSKKFSAQNDQLKIPAEEPKPMRESTINGQTVYDNS